MPFEINRPLNYGLAGTIDAFVSEVDGVEPTTIIDVRKAFKVHVNWTLEGALTPYICGTWCVHIFLESIGDGPELNLPAEPVRVPLHPDNGPKTYEAWIEVPAGTILPEHCSAPYKLVTTVTYRTVKDRPGPMAGFVEGAVLQFYDSGI